MSDSNHLPLPYKRLLGDGAILIIRPAEEDDASNCVQYLNRVGGESDFLSFGDGEFGFSVEEERAYISKIRQSDNALFLIAEVGGKVVGATSFEGGMRPRTRHTGELGISVAKAHWGKGIGRDMMHMLIKWAEMSPVIQKLNLRVRLDNDQAIRLYTDLGFSQEGIITRDLFIEGRLYDCVLMGRAV